MTAGLAGGARRAVLAGGLGLVALGAAVVSPASAATTAAKPRETIRIAVRDDAPPFAFESRESGERRGFLLDLCQKAATDLGYHYTFEAVTAKDIHALFRSPDGPDGAGVDPPDLYCAPVTIDIARMKGLVDAGAHFRFTQILFLATSVRAGPPVRRLRLGRNETVVQRRKAAQDLFLAGERALGGDGFEHAFVVRACAVEPTDTGGEGAHASNGGAKN